MPKQKRIKGEVRSKLLLVAVQTFASLGFDAVSVDEIVAKAGIAKGTFYYYFKSKEDLFHEIIVEGTDVLAEKIQDGLKNVSNREAKIQKLISIEIEFFRQYKDFCLVFVGEFWSYKTRWDSDIQKIQKRYMDLITGVLGDAEEKEVLAAYLFWTSASLALYWQTMHPEYPVTDLTAKITDLVTHGIMKQLSP